MTVPEQPVDATDTESSKLKRWSIWVAIGALIAAAVVSVVWVLIGSQGDIIGRAFLTIFLLAGFAGMVILEAHLAPRRPEWFAVVSMTTWVLALLIGAFLVWMPAGYGMYGLEGFSRLFSFLLIVLVLQLTVLHVRLYSKAIDRNPTAFNRAVGFFTLGLVALLAVMLIVPLTLSEWVRFYDIYWRVVVAVTILAALGTALVPLINVLFAPKLPRAARPSWPTYVDGVTPLPVLPDGTPDWQAYYTGYPTGYAPAPPVAEAPTNAPAQAITAPEPQAPQDGYAGYPPPPPLPPRPEQ